MLSPILENEPDCLWPGSRALRSELSAQTIWFAVCHDSGKIRKILPCLVLTGRRIVGEHFYEPYISPLSHSLEWRVNRALRPRLYTFSTQRFKTHTHTHTLHILFATSCVSHTSVYVRLSSVMSHWCVWAGPFCLPTCSYPPRRDHMRGFNKGMFNSVVNLS